MSCLCLCLLVVMTGCMMPAKTKVTKDGFTARQKTTEAHRAIVEEYDVYRTDCRYDQLALDKTDNQYYCPGDATKEGYNSHIYLAQYMESVLDKWGPETLRAGAWLGGSAMIMNGLRTQNVARMTQSVNGQQSQAVNTNFESPGAVITH